MPRNADHPHWGRTGERRICDASTLWPAPTLFPLRIKHYRIYLAPQPSRVTSLKPEPDKRVPVTGPQLALPRSPRCVPALTSRSRWRS